MPNSWVINIAVITPNSFFVRMASLVSERRRESWLALVRNTLVSFDLSTRGKAVWNGNHNYPEQLSEAASIAGFLVISCFEPTDLRKKQHLVFISLGSAAYRLFEIDQVQLPHFSEEEAMLISGTDLTVYHFIQSIHTPIIASIMWGFSPVRLSKLSKVTWLISDKMKRKC